MRFCLFSFPCRARLALRWADKTTMVDMVEYTMMINDGGLLVTRLGNTYPSPVGDSEDVPALSSGDEEAVE